MLADEPNLPGEILKLLHELGVSLTYHSAWLKRLHRTLVCGAAPSSDDLAADAHCKCMFGQWYYGDIDTRLKESASLWRGRRSASEGARPSAGTAEP